MKSLLQIAAVLTAATLTSTNVVQSKNGNFELLILHNNDMHARFEQTSQLSGICTTADRDAGKCYGGFARVAHVVKEARRAAAAGEGPPVLYLNAGDTYTGTAWFTIYKWKIAAEFINALQPDAVSLGNHEFDNGVAGLTPFLELLTTPVLAANLNLTKVPELSRQTILKKSIVFNVSGTEVGVIGYITPETKTLAVKNNVEFIDEIEALRNEVKHLQELGIKIIIALGHSGYERDKEIARAVEGLDLVIGAHSHTFLWNGTAPDSEASEGDYPTYVTQKSGKIVPIVQAYAFTKYLGSVKLIFDSDGELIKLNGEPIILDSKIPQDAEMLTILERYRKNVTSFYDIVGNTSVILDGKTCFKRECNLGNLIADAMIYRYASVYDGEYWTDAPIAIIQAGGIRASIAHSRLRTEITKEDLLTVLPFKGNVVAMTMNGSVLLQMLEYAVSRYELPKVGEFLQFSGVKVVYNIKNPVGSRVVNAEVRCAKCSIPKYSEIEEKQMYKVLLSEFLSGGGDGFEMVKNQLRNILDFSELSATQYYIERKSPVFPSVEGRSIIILDEPSHRGSSNAYSIRSSSLLPAITVMLFNLILV